MSRFNELLPLAAQVRDATEEGENTGKRVGDLFVDIIQKTESYLTENDEDKRNTKNELIKRIQGKSDDSNPLTDPFKYISANNSVELVNVLNNTLSSGRYRIRLGNVLLDLDVFEIGANTTQLLRGFVTPTNEGWTTSLQYNEYLRVYRADAWSAWEVISGKAVKELINGNDVLIAKYSFSPASNYNWHKLSPIIKAGSLIKVTGGALIFYESKTSENTQIINGSGVAEFDFTYVNNQTVIAEFTIDVFEQSKVGVLKKETAEIGKSISTLQTNLAKETTRATEAETDLLKRIQGTSDNSNAMTDPFKYIDTAGKLLADILDDAMTSGRYRLNYGGVLLDLDVFETGANITQLLRGFVSLTNGAFAKSLQYNEFQRTYNADVWSAWEVISGKAVKELINGNDVLIAKYSFSPASNYNWHELSPIIKAGSLIKVTGGALIFYESKTSENTQIINGSGVAEFDFTYVNNQTVIAEFTIDVFEQSKVGVLKKETAEIGKSISTLQTNLAKETTRATEAETNLAAGLQTVYAAGDNLFFHYTKEDYTDSTMDTYISGEHYIAVEGGKDIFVSGNGYNINAKMYDADYKALATTPISKNTVFTLPDNCSFVKWVVAVYDLVNKSSIMVNYGKESKPYSIFTIDLTGELSDEINEIKTDLSKIAIKAGGEDVITENNVEFTGQYQWQKLETPIKAGSIIELYGAGTALNFYETRGATANLVDIKGIANAEYTYVRNLSIAGSFSIKATEKSKIRIFQEEIEKIKDDVDTLLNPKSEFILTEPTAVVLSSTSEHCLYLDDTIEGDICGKKYGLTGTHFISYGSVAYVDKPVVGTKKGVFLGISATDKVRKEVYVKSVAPKPKTINILDIGSSYIDIGTITERQYNNYTRDGYTVNLLGTMGRPGKRHEARSGGTWDFLVKPLGRAVILDVSGVTSLPITGYPGTTYQDANGIKWTVRGIVINDGVGKLVLSSFSVDTNYGGEAGSGNTDYDVAAVNMPSAGTLTKTTNASTGTSTSDGDDTIQYSAKELVYYNPFWNPVTNELDFAYYINKWGFANPDIITLTFGSNDLGNFAEASQELVDEVVGKAVSVSDRIHEQLPNCKVLITCSCYGYKGVGENNFREVFRIKNIQKYYKTLIERMGQSTAYSDYVRVVPTMCMIDRENGYNISEKTLHSSYPAIKYARDIVHPNTNGFNQFADAMLGYAYELING